MFSVSVTPFTMAAHGASDKEPASSAASVTAPSEISSEDAARPGAPQSPQLMWSPYLQRGGNTLRMSGYPAIGPNGIIGRGDMRVQTLQALEYVKRTVEAGGARWSDIVHMTFFFTDREKWHREAIPARVEFFAKHSPSGELPCITSIGVASLMHPDMLIEIEATAVWE